MKLLHISDIHFGIENFSKIDPTTGLPSRLIDFTKAFDRAVDRAIEFGVDAVLFTGDAYKSRDPNPTVQREFAKRISNLSAKGIAVYLLTGNHDLPNMTNRAHSIEIFETLNVPNVYVARKISLTIVKTKAGPLQIISIPWLTRSNLIAKEEYKTFSIDELNQKMLEKIDNLFTNEIAKLDPQIPAVLAVHASINGAVYSSERSIMLGQDLVLDQAALHSENFDYVAVGHIHKHQSFGRGDVPIVYPGSIERIDFGEVKEDKGFVLLTIDDPGGGRSSRSTDWKFQIDHETRPFKEFEINLKNLDPNDLLNPTQAAINYIQKKAAHYERVLQEAIVKVILQLRPDQEALLKERDIQRLLLEEMGVYHIAAIKREVEHVRRTRLAGLKPEELSPLQLLDKHLESKSVPAHRRELLLKYATALINGANPEIDAESQVIQTTRQLETLKTALPTLF